MPTQGTQRPTYYEGQYLGAEDLTAAITYGSNQLARHLLGGHTWGIAMGLQLKETPSPAGGDQVDVSILPGYGWDGFGRTIVALQPVSLPASHFASIPPDGLPEGIRVPVWLRYREIPTRGPAPGFENCQSGSASSRMQETFDIEVGGKTPDQLHARITIAGRQLDAQAAVQYFLGAQPLRPIFDESIPQQTLPEASQSLPPRWLLPIGVVRWLPGPDAFTPGHFIKSQEGDLNASRELRRYCGVVAQEVAAVDGIIRLRDRSNRYERNTAAIRRDVLVWVEGELQIDKDMRLFGGKLDFRRSDGGSNNVPILLQREDNTAQNTVTLQVAIGQADVKENRFSIGTLDMSDPQNPQFKEKLTVRGDGRAALGISDPQATQLTARLTIEDAQVPLSFLATSQSLTSGGLWRMALTSGVLRFDTNTDVTGNFNTSNTVLALTNEGKVGIGTSAPTQPLHVNGTTGLRQNRLYLSGDVGWSSVSYNAYHNASNDDWVFPDLSRYVTTVEMDDFGNVPRFEVFTNMAGNRAGWRRHLSIKGDSGNVLLAESGGRVGIGPIIPQQTLSVAGSLNVDQQDANAGNINPGLTFGANSGEGIASKRTAGVGANRYGLDFYTGSLPRMSITNDGKVGIGTTTPSTATGGRVLHIDNPGGASALRLGDGATHGQQWEWQSTVINNIGAMNLSNLTATANPLTVLANGYVGIGTNAPSTRLHVADSKFGPDDNPESHVAFIENTNTGPFADVLALKVGAVNPGVNNNFITFFGGSGAVGRIERVGNSVMLRAPGADFAECLPKLDESESFEAGDIVGIIDGKVTHLTVGAQMLTAITSCPVVLGNAYGDKDHHRYPRVSLIGQVPVKVRGPVQAGDVIVASSLNDGVSIAAAPENISIEQSIHVVGQAWESSPEPGVKMVRVAIGLQTTAATSRLIACILAQSEQIRILQLEMDCLKGRENNQSERRHTNARTD